MLVKSVLRALLAMQITAMALPVIPGDHVAIRSIDGTDADEATAYDQTSVWKRENLGTDADEATAYDQTSVWKREELGTDADEATAYDETSVW